MRRGVRAVFVCLYGIAATGKPAPSIRCRYRIPRLSQRGVECPLRARLRTTQSRLELRPTGFDRRQIGRIGRQVLNPSPTTDNRFGNPRDSVNISVEEFSITPTEWASVPLANGGFSVGTVGNNYLAGNFHGPGHEEAYGVFDTEVYTGAFGAKKSN